MKEDLSVNRLAWRLLENLVENPALFGVKTEKTSTGVLIVDAGIHAEGGFEAGRLITEICMGGLAKAEITTLSFGALTFPSIFVYTDHPVIATLGSQYAGWQINEKGCFAIGSGPARAIAQKPRDICEQIQYRDKCDRAVVVLETEKQPPLAVVTRLLKDCGVKPENFAVILTPTTSLAGATQVSGRIVETGIHKLRRLGLDPKMIKHACGSAPIPPVHAEFTKAMARTNDTILYGGTFSCILECEEEKKLKAIVNKAPSQASKAYGKTFIHVLKEAGYDFYKIDPDLFAPARVIMTNKRTGHVFTSGRINAVALAESFGMKD